MAATTRPNTKTITMTPEPDEPVQPRTTQSRFFLHRRDPQYLFHRRIAVRTAQCRLLQGTAAAVVPVPHFQAAVRESDSLRNLILRYKEALLGQVQQTAVCNALH